MHVVVFASVASVLSPPRTIGGYLDQSPALGGGDDETFDDDLHFGCDNDDSVGDGSDIDDGDGNEDDGDDSFNLWDFHFPLAFASACASSTSDVQCHGTCSEVASVVVGVFIVICVFIMSVTSPSPP